MRYTTPPIVQVIGKLDMFGMQVSFYPWLLGMTALSACARADMAYQTIIQ